MTPMNDQKRNNIQYNANEPIIEKLNNRQNKS